MMSILPSDAAVLGRAAARGAHEADGVGVVDHDQGVVAFGQIADAVEVGDRAVHREDAVGGDQAGAGSLRPALRLVLEVRHVVVLVAVALAPCRGGCRR